MKKSRLNLPVSDMVWLSVVGLLVVLQFWWLPGDGGNSADSFSNRLEGSRGLYNTLATLADDGLLPSVRRESTKLVPDDPCTLLMVAPDRYPDGNEQLALRQFVQRGGVLLFVPNWSVPSFGQPDYRLEEFRCTISHSWSQVVKATTPGANSATGANQSEEVESDVGDESADADDSSVVETEATSESATTSAEDDTTTTAGATPVNNPEFQETVIATNALVEGELTWRTSSYISSAPRNAEELLVDASGSAQVSSWRLGLGGVVVCATADPLANRSMLFPKQAEFAVRLVEYATEQHDHYEPHHEIVFSEFLNAAGSYKGASIMVSPLLRAGTLQLLLVATLMAWAGFHRFGPPLRERSEYRRSLAQSAEAVGNLHFSSGDGSTSVQQYGEWFAEEVRRRHGHTRVLDDTAQLARQTGLEQSQIDETLIEVHHASDGRRVSQSEAASAIRRLALIHRKLFGQITSESS